MPRGACTLTARRGDEFLGTGATGVSRPTKKAWMAMALVPLLAGCSLFGRGDPGPTPQEIALVAAEDLRIRLEVEARLAAEPSVGAGRVRVVVTDREVLLHGSVAGFGALRCALANAELTPGVVLVIDFLVLQPGPTTARCLAPRLFVVPA